MTADAVIFRRRIAGSKTSAAVVSVVLLLGHQDEVIDPAAERIPGRVEARMVGVFVGSEQASQFVLKNNAVDQPLVSIEAYPSVSGFHHVAGPQQTPSSRVQLNTSKNLLGRLLDLFQGRMFSRGHTIGPH